jgi:urease accessory protein
MAMMHAHSTLPLLRLLQVADSSFPVGGFAFSHGLEWLAAEGLVPDEEAVASILRAYIAQSAGRQSLPAALAAMRARRESAVLRADRAYEASISAGSERAASRAMGERLLVAAADALGGKATGAYLAAVHEGIAPGHYAIAFGLVARDNGIAERDALAALGFTMASSVTQAAVRLGIVGQSAATRLTADASRQLDTVTDVVIGRGRRSIFGAFLPGLEVASHLHPRLAFRMFAS